MNGAQILVEMLRAYGVRHVFGVPGDTTMPLYDALYAARDEIRHVMARDERAAGFMADAYARLAYVPGVCEGPSGGGATYIVPGVAEANGSSIPLVCFTSDIPLADEGKGTLTAIDQQALLAAAVKWSATVKRAAMLPDVVRRAFRAATTGRPGAVHVVLPEDVLVEEVAGPRIAAEPACTRYPAYRVRAGAVETRRLYDRLAAAARPAIVAGGGAVIAQAWEELTELAQLLHIPVGTSINGKGAIAEDNPWSIGVIGGNGGRPYANDLLAEADTILYVGSRVNSLVTLGWTTPGPETDKTLLQIDADPLQLGNNLPMAEALCGDAKLVLADLVALARAGRDAPGAPPPRSAWTRQELRARAAAWWDEFETKARSDAYPVKPQRIFQALERLLPPAHVVVADPGTMTPFTAGAFELRRPGRSVVIPRAHGGLGYAIPAVVGAKLARPDETVVGLCGDGSFGMSGTELETIARLGLPVTLIHFNNGAFGWIKMLQHLYYDERFFGVDFTMVDYAKIAEGFGLRGVRVEHPDQLEDAIGAAVRGATPTFIDVQTESELTEAPPVHAWQRALAGETAH
ncbi:MAG TPA: thiamine pyrophosphate-binding protein [Thermomicrobiales bacterium]|nr:thiamine pyrophosphate-binding protein [Thermomicrobiales bacterium]